MNQLEKNIYIFIILPSKNHGPRCIHFCTIILFDFDDLDKAID